MLSYLPGIPQEILLAVLFFISFGSCFILTPSIARLSNKLGKVGVDAHKRSKPLIPDMCGIAVWAALGIGSVAVALLDASNAKNSAGFFLCASLAALIGMWDDFRSLGPVVKPLLTAFAAVPILLLGTYTPYPRIPFLGAARVTIVYPLLVIIAIAVLANAINMMNPFNGAMSGTCSISSFTMIICFMITGQIQDALLASVLLGALLAFHYYNRYPARVFSGNVGDLCVGAALGALSIIGRIEVPMIIAMIPHICNAFYFLSSVGGLKERRQVKARPTKLLDDERLDATEDRDAPITLSRLILARGPLEEFNVVKVMIVMTTVSSFLAIFTLTQFR